MISSCNNPEHADADALCSCYTSLHRAKQESEINKISDSCNVFFINILLKHKDNKAELKAFYNALRICQ